MFTDINECEETQDICGANSTCNNTIGAFTCGCEDGFERTNDRCEGK